MDFDYTYIICDKFTYNLAALLKSPMTAYTLPTLSSARDRISGKSLKINNNLSCTSFTPKAKKMAWGTRLKYLLFFCYLQVIQMVFEGKVRVSQFKVSIANTGVEASYEFWLVGNVSLCQFLHSLHQFFCLL